MPLDFASIIRAGQGLVPDIRAQMLQDDQRKLQQQQQQLQVSALQQKQARQAQFQQEAASALQGGGPRAIADLMIKYPEFAESIKPGWEALKDDERRVNLTQVGSAYARANNGDPKGAAKILRQRYDADVAAGQPDPETKELIDALESDDPALQKQAGATIGARLAAYDPDKFAETYKALNPPDKTSPAIREYNDRLEKFGKAAADAWLAVQDTKLVPVQKGGEVYSLGGGAPPANPPNMEGGDQSDPRQGVPPPTVGANGQPTSLTAAQWQATVQSLGRDKTAAWARRNGVAITGTVSVRTVQDANALPPGTVYSTPDGRTFRR